MFDGVAANTLHCKLANLLRLLHKGPKVFMYRNRLVRGAFIILALTCFAPTSAMSQTNTTDAHRWLIAAQLAPPFKVPDAKAAWEKQRQQVRAQLWELLGKLPARPKLPKVETLSREDRGDYWAEKFQFDNG